MGKGLADGGATGGLPPGTHYVDDLYVMQNEHGLIKIGRSANPEQRRKQVQPLDRCQAEIVIVLPERGRREPAVHRALRKHHIGGEWFDGGDIARAAIARVLRAGDLQWPFPLAEAGADAWLERLCDLRTTRLAEKEYNRQLQTLRRCEADWMADSSIWAMLWYSRTRRFPGFDVGEEDGRVTLDAYDPHTEETVRVPPYSADLGLAMTLWPDGSAPSTWDRGAHACCVAALKLVGDRLFSRNGATA